ncbi:hypothetical protein Ancab_014608 [Ancistrocladus abbreviatus]
MKIRRSSDNYLSRGGERIREGRKMGSARRPLILGLILVMVLGFAVYFRLWVIDYRVSSDEAELLRRQFDLANREAMDESAEWRLKYDGEKERADNCAQELSEAGSSSCCLVQFCFLHLFVLSVEKSMWSWAVG